jgi:hypothetical protein
MFLLYYSGGNIGHTGYKTQIENNDMQYREVAWSGQKSHLNKQLFLVSGHDRWLSSKLRHPLQHNFKCTAAKQRQTANPNNKFTSMSNIRLRQAAIIRSRIPFKALLILLFQHP